MDVLRLNTDYALRVMVNLAGHYGNESISTKTVAVEKNVTHRLVCKLMQKLHNAQLVESCVGPKGRFRPSRQPEKARSRPSGRAKRGKTEPELPGVAGPVRETYGLSGGCCEYPAEGGRRRVFEKCDPRIPSIRYRVRKKMAARVTTLLIITLTLSCIPTCTCRESDVTTARDDPPRTASSPQLPTRFGVSADAHLMSSAPPQHEAFFCQFVDAMVEWNPDFVIDLGDFACQCSAGETTPEMHDCQLETLKRYVALWNPLPCPYYHVLGNHDVGWIQGGEEIIKSQDLYERDHRGEDITKNEFLAVTKMPGRYYSFDVKGYHFIVLDGNNRRPDDSSIPTGRDGVEGYYWIDDVQKAWLARDLAANRQKFKLVFCHQELHHTPVEGSSEGGDRPFAPVGKEVTYIDNGWQIREMLRADGRVLACFAGHKHRNRWTVHGGVDYITLAAVHWGGSYAKVTLSNNKLYIEGVGNQKSYTLPAVAAISH